jgi:hypothetical protein
LMDERYISGFAITVEVSPVLIASGLASVKNEPMMIANKKLVSCRLNMILL